jgi:hypothetical protein
LLFRGAAHKGGHCPELVAGHEGKHAMDVVNTPTSLREGRPQRQKRATTTRKTMTPPTLPPIMAVKLLSWRDSGDPVGGDGRNVDVDVDVDGSVGVKVDGSVAIKVDGSVDVRDVPGDSAKLWEENELYSSTIGKFALEGEGRKDARRNGCSCSNNVEL